MSTAAARRERRRGTRGATSGLSSPVAFGLSSPSSAGSVVSPLGSPRLPLADDLEASAFARFVALLASRPDGQKAALAQSALALALSAADGADQSISLSQSLSKSLASSSTNARCLLATRAPALREAADTLTSPSTDSYSMPSPQEMGEGPTEQPATSSAQSFGIQARWLGRTSSSALLTRRSHPQQGGGRRQRRAHARALRAAVHVQALARGWLARARARRQLARRRVVASTPCRPLLTYGSAACRLQRAARAFLAARRITRQASVWGATLSAHTRPGLATSLPASRPPPLPSAARRIQSEVLPRTVAPLELRHAAMGPGAGARDADVCQPLWSAPPHAAHAHAGFCAECARMPPPHSQLALAPAPPRPTPPALQHAPPRPPSAHGLLRPGPLCPLVVEVGQLELQPRHHALELVAVCTDFHESMLGAAVPSLHTRAQRLQPAVGMGAGMLCASFGDTHHVELTTEEELLLLRESLFSPAEVYADLVFTIRECHTAESRAAPPSEGGSPTWLGRWVGEAFVNLKQQTARVTAGEPELPEVLAVYDDTDAIIGHLTVTLHARAFLLDALQRLGVAVGAPMLQVGAAGGPSSAPPSLQQRHTSAASTERERASGSPYSSQQHSPRDTPPAGAHAPRAAAAAPARAPPREALSPSMCAPSEPEAAAVPRVAKWLKADALADCAEPGGTSSSPTPAAPAPIRQRSRGKTGNTPASAAHLQHHLHGGGGAPTVALAVPNGRDSPAPRARAWRR